MADKPIAKVASFGKDTPRRRPGRPSEAAAAYVFSASDTSPCSTGQTLPPTAAGR